MDRQQGGDAPAPVVRRQSNDPNVFDDENEVETPRSEEFSVGDGFGPSPGRRSSETRRPQNSRALSSERSITLDAKVAPKPARSSTYKNRDVFRLSGAPGSSQIGASSRADFPQRTSSGSRASSTYAPTEHISSEPQQSAPSFPYGLYQQSSTGRNPSIATASVARVSTAASSTQRPTHPYALYSQNGLDEGAASASPVQQSIPVGFPGRGDGFHRQIGPDGEEQDIVGPDGHTEQLPPYSRYPEEGAPKIAMPSSDPFRDPVSRDGSTIAPSQTPSSSSRTLVPGAANDETAAPDRNWSEKTWKERRRTKMCGGRLPCWVVTFMIVTAVVFAGLVAGLVGGMVAAAEKKAQSKNKSHTSTTTIFDASPISAPTGVPAVPVGQWALSLPIPEEQQSGCLDLPSQSNAWTCTRNGPPLLFDVRPPPPGQPGVPGYALLGNISPGNDNYSYGSQPPSMQLTNLEWVIDDEDPKAGPALHFQTMYDKLVLVTQNDLTLSSASSKLVRRANQPRQWGPPPPGWPPGPPPFGQKGKVNDGDQPWLCYWNQTFIEGFIYITQNSSQAAQQSNNPLPPTSSTPSSSTWPSSTSSQTTQSAVAAAIAATAVYPTVHAYMERQSQDNPSSGGSPAPTSGPSSVDSSTTTSGITIAAASGLASASSSASSSSSSSSQLPLFPYIVKVEERRMSMDNNQAFCKQMQLVNNELKPVAGPDNGQVILQLSESDPPDKDFQNNNNNNKRFRKRRYTRLWDRRVVDYMVEVRKRDEPADSCHCQWENN